MARKTQHQVDMDKMITAAEVAFAEIEVAMERIALVGTAEDGSDDDLERGPTEIREIDGERILLWDDKVFGGRSVTIERRDGDDIEQWLLGRIADHDTRSVAILPILLKDDADSRAFVPVGTLPDGVWRNDTSGWVELPLTAATAEALIEQMVRLWKAERNPADE